MPFTFAHPAIVLPLLDKGRRRKLFSSTGLVIGSIIPDFESFIRFDQHKAYSHTWPGMFWFDLPLGLIYAYIFHYLVRDALIKNLPEPIGAKFRSCSGSDWNRYFRKNVWIVIYSMLLGIASHLLWDGITHLNLADPNATHSHVRIGRFRLYILLQYMSSAIGLIVVANYIITYQAKGVKDAPGFIPVSRANKIIYWVLIVVIAVATLIIANNVIDEPLNTILFIEVSISGLLIATIVAPWLQKLISRSG